LKKHKEISRELSTQSIEEKTSFILDLVSKGRFVCHNCCTEFYEGLELASPRYSYHNFFDEEDWRLLDFKEPRHNEHARKAHLCNMCYGVCSCGESIYENGVCENCGSLKPITSDQRWRAPDYPRPKTADEWQEMRKQQVRNAEINYHVDELVERTPKVQFAEEIETIYFLRYRFRNTLTDEGIFMEESPDSPAGVVFSVECEDEIYEVDYETSGFYFLQPDSAGNLFVIAISDEDKTAKNSTRVYLHDRAKNWFYYGDSSAGKIFCWDPVSDIVRPVG